MRDVGCGMWDAGGLPTGFRTVVPGRGGDAVGMRLLFLRKPSGIRCAKPAGGDVLSEVRVNEERL